MASGPRLLELKLLQSGYSSTRHAPFDSCWTTRPSTTNCPCSSTDPSFGAITSLGPESVPSSCLTPGSSPRSTISPCPTASPDASPGP
ncbi:hypothetical protein VNO77_03535 [Canavalia gladiata]|uniref:Uncharacterized protein n=1 Tax=Canavalia gladiata TaxID=3824 RepID=A0AAN9MZX0_CANGL